MPGLELPRKRWIALLVALAVVAVTAVVVVVRTRTEACGAESVQAGSPLLTPAKMTQQYDARLSRLSDAIGAMGTPFGQVRAGVGFDYGQWLHLYGVAAGLLAWTKNNAPVTLLDGDTLAARWSLRPLRKRTAWDADAERFLLLDLAKGEPTQVASYDLGSGKEKWCVSLSADQADGEPVATSFLPGGDVLVALPGDGGIEVVRLSDTGHERWSRDLRGMDRADYLGPLIDGVFVAGGSEEFRLSQPDPQAPERDVVSAYSTEDGRRYWSWSAGKGEVAHVTGVSGETTVLVTRTTQVRDGLRLRALDATGAEIWERSPADDAFESTLRGDVVLMRSRTGLDGYDVATGRSLWHKATPTDATYFPYGFTLDQMPSLDAGHVLMPTTTALRVLDVHTGADTSYALPTDGINTTYWPYQLAVTPHLIGIVTNVGGVVTGRG